MKAPPGTLAFAYCFRSGILTPLEALKTPSPLTAKVPLAPKVAHCTEEDPDEPEINPAWVAAGPEANIQFYYHPQAFSHGDPRYEWNEEDRAYKRVN